MKNLCEVLIVILCVCSGIFSEQRKDPKDKIPDVKVKETYGLERKQDIKYGNVRDKNRDEDSYNNRKYVEKQLKTWKELDFEIMEVFLKKSPCSEKRIACNFTSKYTTADTAGQSSTIRLPKENILRRIKRRTKALNVMSIKCPFPSVSCRNRCLTERDFAEGKRYPKCACDPYCHYFKDCCYDYVKYCHKGDERRALKRMKVPDEAWFCRNGIWIIASCPKSWINQTLSKYCSTVTKMTHESYVDVLSVTTPDNKTFANRFCAQCHGYQQQQMEFYQLDFKCKVSPPSEGTLKEKMKFLFQFCKVSGTAKFGFPKRNCFKPVESCGKGSSTDMAKKCKNGYYGLVYLKTETVYKNEYCALCRRNVSFKCGPANKTSMTVQIPFPSQGIPLSIIMNIKGKKTELERFCCPGGTVFDVHSEICRRSHKVVPVPVVSDSIKKYLVGVWLEFEKGFSPYRFNKSIFIENICREFLANSSAISSVELSWVDLKLIFIEFTLDMSDRDMSHRNVITELTSLSKSPKNTLTMNKFEITIIKITVKPLTCVLADTYSPMEYQVISGTSSIYINKTGEMLNQKDYFSNSSRMVQGHPQPVGHIVVCRQMLSGNCSGTYIFLQRLEYIIFPNRSLLYNATNHIYKYGEYTWKNGTVMICTSFTNTYKMHKKESSINDRNLIILTYFGFSISVLCLVFVLVTYSLFPTLRTNPGINLMNLCCALLVAHLLWLVGSGLTFADKGCTAIAIVLHYSFLASFMWMSIIAYDTRRAFFGKILWPRSGDTKLKIILKKMAIGWLPLSIFIIVCIALDQSEVVVIGYGGKKGCWINNSRANLYIFAIPVALSITWNAGFFLLIVRAMRVARKISKMIASQHKVRKELPIYTRIAVLMGFTWVFGFIAPFTSHFLWYPFTIFNSLQGLYIALAFCFTRRVKLMYKKMCQKKKIFGQ